MLRVGPNRIFSQLPVSDWSFWEPKTPFWSKPDWLARRMLCAAKQWTRATAQNLSLSCVACGQHLRRVFLWEARMVHRERMIWGSFLGGLTRPEFSRMFRMDHATFEFVVERLSPWSQRDFLQSKRGGGYISPSL